MKHLWLILLISFEFVWAQELKIKMNDKTAIIAHNQLILIVSQNYDDFIGRFQKIEDDNIILEGSIIPIDQVREIKLINSEFGSSTGFAQGALTCGSLAAVLISLSYAAFFDSSGRDKSKLSSSFLEEEDLKEVFKYILPVAFVGGVMNVVRLSIKAVEATYKIDQDNWKNITS